MTERKHRKTAKTIRNLRGTPVHLRLFGAGSEKPYRIELQPRGVAGDWHTVPANLTDDGAFVAGVGLLFEIVPTSEARKTQYARPGNAPAGLLPVEVVRHDENIVSREAAWDGTGKAPARGVGAPELVDAIGSDAAMHASIRGGESALPEGAFSQTVKVERV